MSVSYDVQDKNAGQSMNEGGSRSRPGWFRRILASWGLLRRARATHIRELHADAPSVVISTPHMWDLVTVARSLAEGQLDDSTLDTLRELARDRLELLGAAALIRQGPPIEEDRIGFIANSLLVEAATDPAASRITSMTESQEAWFREIEAFKSLSIDDAYAEIARREPALESVRVRLLAETSPTPRHPDKKMSVESERECWNRISDGLSSVIGPHAASEDRLVRSLIALWRCRTAIGSAYGLSVNPEDDA